MARHVLRNWAGNQVFSPTILHRPRTIEELQTIVRAAASCRVLGSGHSFNDSAASSAEMIALSGGTFFPAPISIDEAAATVTVPAGATYAEVITVLSATRWALHNAASLPHISVGGAIATGTHGSGVGNGNLATAVRALEIVTADGSIRRFTPADPEFAGSVVHVGALGAVTRVTLALVPAFEIQQSKAGRWWTRQTPPDLFRTPRIGAAVYEDMLFEDAAARLGEVLAGGYSVSLFTTWQRRTSDGRLHFEQVRGAA